MNMNRRCLALAMLLFLISSYAHAQTRPLGEISLEGMDGQQHALTRYIGQGQWVFLTVWATRCPICVDEMPDLQSFHDDFSDKNAMVLGLSIDFPSFGFPDKQVVATFMENYVLDFPNLLVDEKQYAELGAGPLQGTPTMLVFNPEGQLVAKQLGKVSYDRLVRFMRTQTAKRRSQRKE